MFFIIHKIKNNVLFSRFFWGIINVGLFLPFGFLRANGPGECGTCTKGEFCNPLCADSFEELVGALANIAFAIGVPIAVVFIIWSGFLFVSARGSEEKLKKAKTTFMWAIIGTAVLLGAKIIAETVGETIQSL